MRKEKKSVSVLLERKMHREGFQYVAFVIFFPDQSLSSFN